MTGDTSDSVASASLTSTSKTNTRHWSQPIADKLGLRYHQDLYTLWFLFCYFAIQIYLWSLPLSHLSLLLPKVLLITTTIMAFGVATIVHNSMHLPPFRNTMSNRIFCLALTIGYGHPVTTFISGHNISHHPFTQQRLDHMRTSKVRYKIHFLNLILFYFRVAGDVMKADFKYLLLQRKNNRIGYYNTRQEFITMVSVMIPLLYSNPMKFLFLWQIPRFFASYCIVTMNILQHDGCDDDDGDTNVNTMNMNTARNFTGKFINFLTFNNGYHTIHHIKPGLHWSLIPEYHDKLVEKRMHVNLNQKNMAKYIFTTFVYPGNRVMYDGRPVVFKFSEKEDVDLDWMDKRNIFKK